MAYLFKRSRSPYWWIGFRVGAEDRQESTKLRWDERASTRKAREIGNQKTADELKTKPTGQRDRWEFWVLAYISEQWEGKRKTLSRYELAWRNVAAYLSSRNVHYPAQLSYLICREYLSYRKRGDKSAGVLDGHHNTALFELKFLSRIMREAVKRGFASINPASKMGISKIDPKEKPEITDEHLGVIWKALQAEPEWMRVAWQIALYTGCRLRATMVALSDIDIPRRRILFHEKRNKVFQVPMRAELVPLFESPLADGRKFTCELPGLPSKDFFLFFKSIGLPQYCFHCTRVTFITRAARAGLQERDVMRLVNHASTTIHRVYLRLRADDLDGPLQKIQFPSFAPSSLDAGQSSDARPATASRPQPSPCSPASQTQPIASTLQIDG